MTIKIGGKLGEHSQFGPVISKFKMTDILVKTLNSDCMNTTIDYKDRLVGIMEHQLLASDGCMEAVEPFFLSCVAEHTQVSSAPDKNVTMNDLWYNRMTNAWDHNPIHFHANCAYSSVGFLKVPDEQPHGTGNLCFYMEAVAGYPSGPVTFVPAVGDYYVFPWHLQHFVNPIGPFKGERRSFSINFSGTKKGLKT